MGPQVNAFPEAFEGDLRITMEKLQMLSERSDGGWIDKIWFKLMGAIHDGGSNLQLTYGQEDVDREVLAKLLEHPDEVNIVAAWHLDPDYSLAADLEKACRVLRPLLKNWQKPVLYRGFRPKAGQDHMGLKLAGYRGEHPEWLKVGSKFSYVPKNPLSFTYVPEIARAFGTIIVKIDATKYYHRILPIDETLMTAIMILLSGPWTDKVLKEKYLYTQAEHLVLPSKQPVEFEVVAIHKK